MGVLHKLPVLVWQEGDVYVADCPPLQIASQGVNEAEALSNLKEAIELYFEDIPLPELPEFGDTSHAVVEFSLAS